MPETKEGMYWVGGLMYVYLAFFATQNNSLNQEGSILILLNLLDS